PAGDDPASAVRPLVRLQGAVLDREEEEHPRRGLRRGAGAEAGAGARRSPSAGGILDLGAEPGTVDRQPAPGVCPGRRAASGRGRPEGLAADRPAPDRPAGPRAGLAADAGRFLYADQVPGTLALPLAGLHLRAAPRVYARPGGIAGRPADPP